MLGEALASILRSRLGQYLDTQDLEVNVAFGREIVLKNVKLKESALRDAGLPLRCVYGKIQRLEISIPWMSIYTNPTVIRISGLYMLIVPSTSVPYDEEKEAKAEQEAKMAKIASIEEAKQRNKLIEANNHSEDGDSFIQKLTAKIMENLQITIQDVHIRIEDNRTNKGYPFGAGVTLDKLDISTNKQDREEHSKEKYFSKKMDISSLAVYWQPHEKNIYSEQTNLTDEVRDSQFSGKIARNQEGIKNMKYLLGPVTLGADLRWCPDPERTNYTRSLIELSIDMKELRLSITKYQYHDFAMLLHSFNSMKLGAKYRKYKVAAGLEGLPNYMGKSKQLWQFVINTILEEEVRPKLKMWNLENIMTHTANCREYRELYKEKLLGSKSTHFEGRLKELETILDVFNITMNRDLAESAAKAKREADAAEKASGGFLSWIWGSKKVELAEEASDIIKLNNALTMEEKAKLYEAIGYQEGAEEGILEYPRKSFVKYRMNFYLAGFRIALSDEDLKDRSVMVLQLDKVNMMMAQRPAASNMLVNLTMQSLTVTGVDAGENPQPKVITTISTDEQKVLLNLQYEINPPLNSDDLDNDPGSVYDRRLHINSSPLEIIYHMKTFNHVAEIFKAPEEIQISYLQDSAIQQIREYREVKMSKLGWEFVIENHKFRDIDIQLQSSYIVIPYKGEYKEGCPCLVANLGSIRIKSEEVTETMRMLRSKKGQGLAVGEQGQGDDSAQDKGEDDPDNDHFEQAYDKYSIKLENMELMFGLENENWRKEMQFKNSKLHILKPIDLDLSFHYCLIHTDPNYPITKLTGLLPVVGLRIEDRRLFTLAELLEKALDPEPSDRYVQAPQLKRTDSEASLSSTTSSLATGNSTFIGRKKDQQIVANLPDRGTSDKPVISSNIVQLDLSFIIGKLELEVDKESEPFFKFAINATSSKIEVKENCLDGQFEIYSCICEHLKFKMADGSPVRLLDTDDGQYSKEKVLSVHYKKLNPGSSEWNNIKQSVEVAMSSVHFCIHQDAILDLARETSVWMSKIQSRAGKLMQYGSSTGQPDTVGSIRPLTPNRSGRSSPALWLQRHATKSTRRLSRQSSLSTSMALGSSLMDRYKPKYNKTKSKDEIIQMHFKAQLKEVVFTMMTSYANFSSLQADNLEAEVKMSKSKTEIQTKLMEFKIQDCAPKTKYKMIAESIDKQLFDLSVTLNNQKTPGVPDVVVKATMSRLRLVFLMKYINDIRAFIDPFTNLKAYMEELSTEASEKTLNLAKEVISSATRVKLDFCIAAPDVIFPIFSESRTKFEANLGSLLLRNNHRLESGFLMDELSIEFSNISLSRTNTDTRTNAVILEPVSFELEVARNVTGAFKPSDPADIKVTGTLNEVRVHFTKDDYNCIIAMLSKNFSEKGVIKKVNIQQTNSPNIQKPGANKGGGSNLNLSLPIKAVNLRKSRELLFSTSAPLNQDSNLDADEKHPKSKTTVFKFVFKEFSINLATANLVAENNFVPVTSTLVPLAKIGIDRLEVDGNICADGELAVHASLNNAYLEDTRPKKENVQRIVRLLEAKPDEATRMIKIEYTKDSQGSEEIRCKIYSCNIVACVSYLMQISDFFIPGDVLEDDSDFDNIPDEASEMHRQSKVVNNHYQVPTQPAALNITRKIIIRIDEPDIVLANDIENRNSEAILLNAQLNIDIIQNKERRSINMTVDNLRGHTCKFRHNEREHSMAQILKPTNMAMHYSQDLDSRKTRIDMNFSSLVLNVSPNSIQILLNSYNTFMTNMQVQDIEEDKPKKKVVIEDNLWKTTDIKEEEHWYLKPDECYEAEKYDAQSLASTCLSEYGDEQMIFKIQQLIVILEYGRGNNTVPLVLVESKVNGELRNWSYRMCVKMNLELEAAYYNSTVALWEPVIERLCVEQQNGLPFTYRWKLEIQYINNSKNDFNSAILSPNFDEADGFYLPEVLPPVTELKLYSTQPLQVTITRTFISVVNSLIESFSFLDSEKTTFKTVREDLIVKNLLGKSVTVDLFDVQLALVSQGAEVESILIPTGEERAIGLKMAKEKMDKSRNVVSPLQQQSEETSSFIRIKVEGEKNNISIPIGKTDMRFFPFQERGSEFGYELGFVSEVSVVNCSKTVTLKSVVVFKNYYPHPVKIWTEEEGRFREMTTLQSLEEWNAPTTDVYTHGGKFHFSLSGKGQNMGIENMTWKEIELEDSVKKKIECTNTEQKPSVFLNVEGLATDIFRENSRNLTGRTYTISIRPVAVLKNCLPVPLFYTSRGKDQFNTLSPGEIGVLEDIRHGQSLIRLRLYGWRNADLECDKIFEECMKELEYWTFTSSDVETNNGYRLDLGVQKEMSKGTTVLSIFAPFWFVNKTKRTLYFKGHDGNYEVAHYPEEEKVPMMFSYITRSFFGKKKISLRVDASHWSDPFTIDTIGDTGKIVCKMDSKRGSLKRNFISLDRNAIKEASYNIGIQISQSSASLTKIVTFTPYFMVYNSADFNIEMKEVEEDLGGWTLIPSKACVPVWPFYGAKAFICRVEGYLETTVPFSLLDNSPSLLMLANKFGGIDVRTKMENSQVLVTLGGYKPGYAPVLLVNNTIAFNIEYGEAGSDSKHFLSPGKKCLYTWQKPSGTRTFVWTIQGANNKSGINFKQVENSLKSDGCDSYSIGHLNFSWVSFLDGMQRVLLFTMNSLQAEKLAKCTGEEERIEQDIDISIHGIGVSLVNNDENVRKELAYLSVSSSNIVWEVRQEGKNRYRPLTINQCAAIEKDCENFKRLMAVNQSPSPHREFEADGTTIIIDYAQDRMEKPYRGKLRRQFQKGLWLQVRRSPHQRQIHMKVNHIQLDNQLNECLYPVIAAPVPPPKSVTAQSVPHPFLEVSVLEYTSPAHMDMKQYKYIHALIQEMQLKIELGFINAISCLFEEEEILDENTPEKLEKDLELARKPLQEHAILTVSQGKKDFYDYLHMSPLKIHVSFSLTSHNSRRDGGATRGSNFILLLLQSFGVTITDSNDIIFRLAYFERKHQFYGIGDLLAEINRHYTSQAVKQMYVVLLGLDVIGNPYGLAVGVARSVEDLFYEPFQGAVEGPGEFAEGLSIGVRSVFSGVVGGAAGTVSKITGALGKGLATLTFDEKFQNKRRETIKRREQQNLVNGMASNVKDLSIGIVGGVAGVFIKPYEGATQEGVGGFFKGVGKGVAGLVTRPTGGIIDFASGTFDTVKRATEVGDQFTRVRPARYIHPDGVVRCYDRKEAEGQKILISVEKGRYSDDFYMLHENLVQEREAFMVTKKRIMKLKTVLGAWNVEWQYEYDKLLLPPSVLQEGDRWVLIIQPKEEKKGGLGGFFSKNTEKKVVLPENTIRDSAQLLARVIDALIKCNNNFESIFTDMIVSKNKLAMESW